MGSILRKDKIGALQESGGNILLQASILTIGGRQYETTTQIQVALPSLTANSRYQVYAVQTAGVVSLVISVNENSQGPAGYNSWKLVGSFLTDNVPAFDEFTSIKMAPKRKAYLDATGNGNFTGGLLLVERLGNQVTISVEANLTHSSLQNPVSATGFLPTWARPTTEITNTYKFFGSSGDSVRIFSDGQVTLAYRTSGLAGANKTSSEGVSIAYNVPESDSVTIEDL